MAEARIGFMPPSMGAGGTPQTFAAMLQSVEDAGLDHVTVGDHVSFHVGFGFDGLINATALSMLHPRLPVHTAVYLLPLRHPVTVARQVASLEQLAPGRLRFGVGIGGEDRREVANCGTDPRTRGRRMNECLEILRPLLAGETISYQGEFFDLDNASILPSPDPPTPIIVGGRSDAAIDRAGRYGDGWVAVWVTVDRWCEAMVRFEAAAAAAGRSDTDRQHGLLVWCGIAADRESARKRVAEPMEMFYQTPFERFEKYTPYGTPADIAEFLAPYAEAGTRDFHMVTIAGDEAEAIAGAGEIRRLLNR